MPSRKRRLRVVLDTNVILSKYIAPEGIAGRAFDYCYLHSTLLASLETIAELASKLCHEKFAKYGGDSHAPFLDRVISIMELVDVQSSTSSSPDPDDNMFLALAEDGRADYVVSGDKKHLQVLGSFEGIPILSPGAFLDLVASRPDA